MKFFLFSSLSILGCLFFVSCNREQLPNGVELYRSDTGKFSLVSSKEIDANGLAWQTTLIEPDIIKLGVSGIWIVGYSQKIEIGDNIGTKTLGGYFVLNSETKKGREGLTKGEYDKYTKSLKGFKLPFLKKIR